MLRPLGDSFSPYDDVPSEGLLDEVCRYIHAVHGVEGQAFYHFGFDDLGINTHAEHTAGYEIVINRQCKYPILAGIHEMGHALDAVFLNSIQVPGKTPDYPPDDYSSDMALAKDSDRDLLSGWLGAVQSTQHFQNLIMALTEDGLTPLLAGEIKKLLNVRELWARSYELYICNRHKGTDIDRQMGVECSEAAYVGSLIINNYWQGSDFNNVEDEIGKLFRRLGW